MMDIQAALGIHQLARLENNLKIRERHWQAYDEAFAGLEGITTPPALPEHSRHARHLYTLLLDADRLNISRQEFMNALQRENIGTGIHFTSLHLLSFYRERYGYKRGDFPNAEFISDRTVSLPLSSALDEDDVGDVINAVRKVVAAPVPARYAVAAENR